VLPGASSTDSALLGVLDGLQTVANGGPCGDDHAILNKAQQKVAIVVGRRLLSGEALLLPKAHALFTSEVESLCATTGVTPIPQCSANWLLTD
jgi:hypothetical protein